MVDDWQRKFDAALATAASTLQIDVPGEVRSKLRSHFASVVETNRSMNLTRITEPAEAAVKHYADSLALLAYVNARQIDVRNVLDVGTGAGFPAVPLAILRPGWRLTAIDSTRKKADFVRRVAKELELTNLVVEHARAGEWDTRERFDLVIQRAVAKLAVALTSSAPLLAAGGRLAAYKTARLDTQEERAAARTAKRLGLGSEGTFPYKLEWSGEVLQRALVIYRSG